MTPWRSALPERPLLSLDGDTLLVSGLDGTTQEARVPAALTVESTDEFLFVWYDGTPRTGLTPLSLGEGVELFVSGGGHDDVLSSIGEVYLEPSGSCAQEFAPTSLRSDGILLAPDAHHLSDAFTADDPAPCDAGIQLGPEYDAVRQLLRSGPTVAFDSGTMVISGTIPESLLDQSTLAPDAYDATSEQDAAEPIGTPDIPGTLGTPKVIVMAEGAWAPSRALSPLTAEEATGRRWLPVDTAADLSTIGLDPSGERGLSFDGSTWRVRGCGLDLEGPGTIEDGRLVIAGDMSIHADPDPGAACVYDLSKEGWAQLLTHEPAVSTDGTVLVLAGGIDDVQLGSAGMALIPDGVNNPWGGPTSPVTLEDLAAGVTEVPGDVASDQVGVSDNRDPQPGHATTLTMEDGFVSVDVGCAEPLRGPAWFSQAGPEAYRWQLTAVLPTPRNARVAQWPTRSSGDSCWLTALSCTTTAPT